MARILIEAIQNGQETLARDIIQCGSYGGIDSQTSRRDGTALFFCCSRGYLELAKLLLERGASVTSTDKNRATPLHAAVDNGHLDIVRLLISHGAQINAQTYRGDTPLHLAAYRGFGEITQCLVESGANSQLVNTNSFTAENEAIGQGHLDLGNYLRTSQRAMRVSERAGQSFDSMIPLDPPAFSHTDRMMEADLQNNHYQKKNPSLHQTDVEVRKKKPDNRPDANLRSKSCDYDTGKLNNLSVITLDPPSDPAQACWTLSQRKRLIHRHSTGRTPPTILLPSANLTTGLTDGQCYSSPFSASSIPTAPSLFHSSSGSFFTPSTNTSRSASTFPQMLAPSNISHCSTETQRRPSTGSTGSCFSDLSGSTGSDVGSLPSSGSDASGFFSDNRREDIELQDKQLTSNCVDVNHFDKDSLNSNHLLSLGVKSPPVQKTTRHSSTTSECMQSSDFSDIYDSTLFSLTSVASGPRSSLVSGPPSSSVDLMGSADRKIYSRQASMEVGEFRPCLNRATSTNCAFPASNVTFKVRPDFNKSISAEYRPKYAAPLQSSEICPSFDRMPSNDLSSSLSMSDKPSCSMTCVNIPLN